MGTSVELADPEELPGVLSWFLVPVMFFFFAKEREAERDELEVARPAIGPV